MALLKTSGYSAAECDALFASTDADKSGHISFEEFVELMSDAFL